MGKFLLMTACAAAFLFPGAPAVSAEAENLLEGAGFDEPSHRWVLREGAEITGEVSRSGAKSLKMSESSGQAFITASGLEPGKFYRADAWVLTRGMPSDAYEQSERAYVHISAEAEGRRNTRANLDNHDWEPVVCWFQAADEKPVRIYLSRGLFSGGEVFFDDITLRECENPNVSPVAFEDGTPIGVEFYHGRRITRVVRKPTPRGGEHCLLGAPASIRYSMPRSVSEGMLEFDFTVKLEGGRGRFSMSGLRLDLSSQISNRVERDGAVRTESLGIFTPGRWHRFRGIVDLDAQTYELEVTDFEDPLYSFTRRNLNFQGTMENVASFWISSPEEGGFWDYLYLGPVRTPAE